jgi:hypothetical protein
MCAIPHLSLLKDPLTRETGRAANGRNETAGRA